MTAQERIIMKREVPLTQGVDLGNQGGYDPETLEQALDKLTMAAQQQQEEIDRSIVFTLSSDLTGFLPEIPSPVDNGGKVLGIKTDETGFELLTPNSSSYFSLPGVVIENSVLRTVGTDPSQLESSEVVIDDDNVLTAPGGFAANKGSDIASAANITIGAGLFFDITGSVAITGMTVAAKRFFVLQFDAALTLTHGVSLSLPGGANIPTATGDVALFYAVADDTVACISYQKASGEAVVVDANTLFANVHDILEAGYGQNTEDDGTIASGTYTPDITASNRAKVVVEGNITLGTLAQNGSMRVDIVMDSSGGHVITTSSFTNISGTFSSDADAVNHCLIERDGSTHNLFIRQPD
jgi:hypothetical protein